jgi:hypothetical protein
MSETLARYHKEKLSSIANSQIDRILPGELAPTLAQLGMDYPTELARAVGDNISIAELTKMLKVCPLSHRAVEILALRGTPTLGEYSNGDDKAYFLSRLQPRTTKQEWLRSNFETMTGSLDRTIGMMLRQAVFYGHSVAEIIGDNRVDGYPNQVRLTRLKVLEPERYRFAGRLGDVDRIVYYPTYQSPFPIPLEKLLVVYIPRADSPEDPYGDCAGARAYPFYLARQLMYKSWVMAGQKQATGHIVYKTESEKTVQLLNSQGQPILTENGQIKMVGAVYAIVEMEKKAQAGAPRVVDKRVDVSTVNPGGGENFFNTLLPHLQKMILYCYGLPSTILDDTQSGIGNATINSSHMMILDSQIKGLMDICKQELLEKIVRPLLVVNFGVDSIADLGEFTESSYVDPNQSSMMVSNIMQATMQGFVDATDLEATNKVRMLLGLSVISREEWDAKQMAKYELEMSQQQEIGVAPA